MLVRRRRAESHVKTWAGKWNRTIASGRAGRQPAPRERLLAWQRDSAAGRAGDDRIGPWIDQELKRLDDPAQVARTPLMPVHLSRSDVRSLVRRTPANLRLLAWAGSADCPTSNQCRSMT